MEYLVVAFLGFCASVTTIAVVAIKERRQSQVALARIELEREREERLLLASGTK